MSQAMDLTAANFAGEVEKAQTPVLVDFWAPWCGPCKMMGPVIDAVASARAGTLKVAKVNCDEEGDLAARFGITSIPCLILFRKGAEVDRRVGAVSESDLGAWIDGAL